MAIGLKFDKQKILGKDYRDITAALQLDQLFGKLTLREAKPLFAFEDDLTQPRNADGSYPQASTGEILGIDVDLRSSVQSEVIKFTIVGVTPTDFEALGIAFNDEVVLEGIRVAYYAIPQGGNRSNNGYKLFAAGISKAGDVKAEVPKKDDKIPQK